MITMEGIAISKRKTERLNELKSYKILDTPIEEEFDELTQIASFLFETPISLISFVDDNRQWFKSKTGINISETPIEMSFCRYALEDPDKVLIVEDPLNDPRFKDNPFVVNKPEIRFYAGAPLKTLNGNVLGTLCIMDNKPRQFSKKKISALQLLAKKVMDYLEMRRLLINQKESIAMAAGRLKKLSDQAPGAIYQLEMNAKGNLRFSFVSEGLTGIHPNLDPEILKNAPNKILDVIHPEDLPHVKESIIESFKSLTSWYAEYRVIHDNGAISWHSSKANPEKQENGNVVWYGTFQDITQRKQYIEILEKILFDISHVLRKPVATLLGLTDALEDGIYDKETLKEYVKNIKAVSTEMDSHIGMLNENYLNIKKKVDRSVF